MSKAGTVQGTAFPPTQVPTVREIAKIVYIKSCDVIGRAKTTTNHIVREGLKTSELFTGKPYCNATFRKIKQEKIDSAMERTNLFWLAITYSI